MGKVSRSVRNVMKPQTVQVNNEKLGVTQSVPQQHIHIAVNNFKFTFK